MAFGVIEIGDSIVRSALTTMQNNVRREVDARVWNLGERIMTESARLAPVDTGYLRASRFQRWGPNEGSASVVELGYSAEYALWVHEIPAAHNPPTRWQFLLEPAMRIFSEATSRAQASAQDSWDVFASEGLA